VHRILLYKTGETDPSLVPDIGCYEKWFARVLGAGYAIEIHLAFDKPKHTLTGYDGMVVSGSPRSLVQGHIEPWMDEAADFVRRADDAGVPVLGVCFGHQLIGYAFGGCVRQNPNGWEVGTVDIQVTDDGAADPLFANLPRRLRVNQSHRDEVEALGPRAKILATGPHTEHQAIAIGDHVRGVQFHPEMDAPVIRKVLAHRRGLLSADAQRRARPNFCVDRLIANASDTPDGERVLVNFVDHFVKRHPVALPR
jgi:GMP synthase (glutamine-hydrolysing)